jgi:hypothetical protein
MNGSSRATVAIALGYLVALAVVDASGVVRPSWVVIAIAISGAVAGAAGIRALRGTPRLLLGGASAAGFTVLGAIGFPVTVGLVVAGVLMAGSTLSLFEARPKRRGRSPHADGSSGTRRRLVLIIEHFRDRPNRTEPTRRRRCVMTRHHP